MNKEPDTVLLIDNSNTRTKLLFSVDGKLKGSPVVFPTKEITVAALREFMSTTVCRGVMVASVVPTIHPIIAAAFSAPVHFLTSADKMPISYDYEGTKTLGADRVANALGLLQKGHMPCIAVDLGTAATFEVVTLRESMPTFVGGVIAPGMSLLAEALSIKTAQLPHVTLTADVSAMGGNTVTSIQSGCFWGGIGMVREILSVLCAELKPQPYIVATGGDAELVASKLELIDEVDPLLTFRGLNMAAQLIFR